MTRLTDYGIVLLTQVARSEDGRDHTARELASTAKLPLPTVGKLLKTLASGGLLASHRGANGGYRLARPAESVTVAEIIRVLEGPISLTECTASGPSACEHETGCAVRSNWRVINGAIQDALEKVTLAEMARPLAATPTGPRLWGLSPSPTSESDGSLTP